MTPPKIMSLPYDPDKSEVEYILKSEYDALEAQVAELTVYADKLADGFPEGMLPKDIEVIKQANVNLAQEVAELTEEVMDIQHGFNIQQTAAISLSEKLSDMHSRLKEVVKSLDELANEEHSTWSNRQHYQHALAIIHNAFPEVLK